MLLVLLRSFSKSKCFVLFELIVLLRLINLASKSLLVTKFACANPAAKFYDVNLLDFEVVMYLS